MLSSLLLLLIKQTQKAASLFSPDPKMVMLGGVGEGVPNAVLWMDNLPQHQHHPLSEDDNAAAATAANGKENDDIAISAASSLTTFKSMLQPDWYMNQVPNNDFQTVQNHMEIGNFCPNPAENGFLLPQSIDSSASCSPSAAFTLDPSFLAPKSCFSSLISNNPYDNAFDFASDTAFLGQFQPNFLGFTQNQLGSTEFSSNSEFQGNRLLTLPDNSSTLGGGFNVGAFEANLDFQTQPTLFQKRAAMRQGSAEKLGNLEVSGMRFDRKRKRSDDGEIEDFSGFNYDSDELNEEDYKVEESGKNGGSSSTVTGVDQKGKKKGMPAKNLMAERRPDFALRQLLIS